MAQNNVNFEARLQLVRRILLDVFNYNGEADIVPIHYDPESPFKYNNFVYRVTLDRPANTNHREGLQPGCTVVPDGKKSFIFRLTNPDSEGMSPATRVENEVAIIALASKALSGFKPFIVPAVYAWSSAGKDSSTGWIVQELMPGVPLDEKFDAMDAAQKQHVLGQMAEILNALQNYPLPASITGPGGVTFDGSGSIVSAAMTSVGSGPWPSFEESYRARLRLALEKADGNPYIKGWHANGVRERIDNFVARGLAKQFRELDTANDFAIVHADFTFNNLFVDEASQRITALLDYDFACIMHPCYEFLRSFDGAGGQFRGWMGEDAGGEMALREAKLHGFPSTVPEAVQDIRDKWDVAKMWEEELETRGIKRPRTIRGIEGVADVDTIMRSILPWRVSNSDIFRLQSEEVIVKCRNENEKQLEEMLNRIGF